MWRAVLGLLVLATAQAEGYSPARPVRHDVPSPNRAFVLDVDPAAKRLTVYATGDRTRPLWAFDRPVWQEQHFLSDDGRVVAVVSWRFVQVDDVASAAGVEFWGRAGRFRAFPVGELCPDPATLGMLGFGPVGDCWRKG